MTKTNIIIIIICNICVLTAIKIIKFKRIIIFDTLSPSYIIRVKWPYVKIKLIYYVYKYVTDELRKPNNIDT